MEELNNSELLLLCNLIYLKFNIFKEDNVGNLIENMLFKNNFKKSILKKSECKEAVKENEWMLILKQIKNSSNLKELTITNIDADYNGLKAACFTDKKDNAYVVFRGTKTIEEWSDNGQGAYKVETKEQLNALNYVSKLKYKRIIVTGHSKGGNKAKYTALLSDKVNKCISFDGQGFSNEFIRQYNKQINSKKSNILSINAKYDYVNCLLNSINEEKVYINTSFQRNPLYYHKPNIMLDNNGNLRNEAEPCSFIKIINDFSKYLISELQEPHKSFVINGLTDVTEMILCKRRFNKDLLQIAKSILVLWQYTKYYDLKKELILIENLMESLSLPLMFWNDFINFEENKSKALLYDALTKFKSRQDNIVFRLKNFGIQGENIATIINNATDNLITSFQNI